jgi:hypothetical protein
MESLFHPEVELGVNCIMFKSRPEPVMVHERHQSVGIPILAPTPGCEEGIEIRSFGRIGANALIVKDGEADGTADKLIHHIPR